MGSWFSKNEEVDVENNITQEVTPDEDDRVVFILTIICIIKFIELFYMIWKSYHNQLKKKIRNNLANQP
jgi:hypothetical protein